MLAGHVEGVAGILALVGQHLGVEGGGELVEEALVADVGVGLDDHPVTVE